MIGDLQKRLTDGTWEKPVDVRKHQRWVEVDGMRVPVLSLEYEYHAYRTLGRVEKAEMLQKWMQGTVR